MMKTVILSSPKVNMIIALLIKAITLAILTNIISLSTVVVTSPSIAQMISMTNIGKNSVTSGQSIFYIAVTSRREVLSDDHRGKGKKRKTAR